MQKDKILVTGALGQIGSELVGKLREIYGKKNVIATDIKTPSEASIEGTYVKLDVNDKHHWRTILSDFGITQVYHLAAMLSARAEKHPMSAWTLNTVSVLNLMEFAKDGLIDRIYWPSSIAVWGRGAVKDNTPQGVPKNPQTLYGIAKLAGERFCEYYNKKYDIDVRCLRYPGLISWKTRPGGGTTDYAVEMFYDALEKGKHTCYLKENTALPMLYMDDAVRATIELMSVPKDDLTVLSSYNLGGLSFTPAQLADEIRKHIPDFEVIYEPDERQIIADTWPRSIDDSQAQKDWGWEHKYSLEKMTETMLKNLSAKLEMV